MPVNTIPRFAVALLLGVLLSYRAGASQRLSLDGRVVRVDLDGDGKRERVALRSLPSEGKFRRFSLSINGVKWQKKWSKVDESENVTSVSFAPLRRNSRQLFIFVNSQSSYEPITTMTKIYRWRRGQLQQVSPLLQNIGNIYADGSVLERTGYQWIGISYRWKLNRRGVLKRVRRTIHPIYSGSLNPDGNQRKISIQLGQFARFYHNPSWKGATVTLPRGTSVVFTGINDHNWLRTRVGKQVFWIDLNVVEQSFFAFPFPRAG